MADSLHSAARSRLSCKPVGARLQAWACPFSIASKIAPMSARGADGTAEAARRDTASGEAGPPLGVIPGAFGLPVGKQRGSYPLLHCWPYTSAVDLETYPIPSPAARLFFCMLSPAAAPTSTAPCACGRAENGPKTLVRSRQMVGRSSRRDRSIQWYYDSERGCRWRRHRLRSRIWKNVPRHWVLLTEKGRGMQKYFK